MRQLDIVRATVCSLSRKSSTEASAVHTNKIIFLANRLGFNGDVKTYLEILEEMREIQRLANGFWFPTPTRFVRLKGGTLIVSILPTSELERLCGFHTESMGHMRVAANGETIEGPFQELSQWLGRIPSNIKAWTKQQLNNAATKLQPTVSLSQITEVYACWESAKDSGTQFRRWCPLDATQNDPPNAPQLCRRKRNFGGYEYFFAKIKNRIVKEEAAADQLDLIRIQYGLDSLFNLSNKLEYRPLDNEKGRLVLFNRIPEAEARLLRGVAREGEDQWPREYIFPSQFSDDVLALLGNLGYSIQGS